MPTRRQLLGGLTVAAATTACSPGSTRGDSAPGAAGAPGASDDDTALEPIVANADFYRVSINSYLPDADWLAAWTLTLADDDGNSVVLTLDELRALGGSEQERTLSCIGSGSGATTGNAMWTARRLDAIFADVGFEPDERLQWLRFYAGDGFYTDLPRSDLAKGLALAWGMNGVDLPGNHGAPLRALVPGRYGMKNPKWIERIEVVETFAEGFWESRGWSQDAEYLTASWFKEPTYGATVTTEGVWVKGLAFAGERGISRVEVSADGGTSWADAEVTYEGGAGVWTLWRFHFVPPLPGTYTLRVRATAADGEVQPQIEVYDVDLDGLEAWDQLLLYVE
ncbi:MAG: hypothetical protein EXR71_17700 [Myxococcales bacterium]|nr:hypothetical protein [Myxococcales bacterium]